MTIQTILIILNEVANILDQQKFRFERYVFYNYILFYILSDIYFHIFNLIC